MFLSISEKYPSRAIAGARPNLPRRRLRQRNGPQIFRTPDKAVDIGNIANPFNKNLTCAVFAGNAGVDFSGTWAYGFATCCGAVAGV
jgi:hypothetical protein